MLRILSLVSIVLTFTVTSIHAQEMTSPEYKLKLEQIEASDEAALSSIRPEVALKLREDGYYIASYNENSFTFTISNTTVDIEESKHIYTSVRSENTYGYQLSAFLWTPLQSRSGSQIPASYCNTLGCSSDPAKLEDAKPGWGYKTSGPDTTILTDLANIFIPMRLQHRFMIAESQAASGERASQLEFKVTKESNDNEIYNSIIQLLALPSI